MLEPRVGGGIEGGGEERREELFSLVQLLKLLPHAQIDSMDAVEGHDASVELVGSSSSFLGEEGYGLSHLTWGVPIPYAS